MPDITPYVPTAPEMPELPDEIPFPPEIDWPDIPPWVPPDYPPWDPGGGGGLWWYPGFADRLMRLIIATAVHRGQLGEVPGYPPFDLRSMVSFVKPAIINLAIAWFVTLWNTHPIEVMPIEGTEVFVEASLDDGYILPPSTFAYDTNLVVSRTHCTGIVFRGFYDVPKYSTVTGAFLHLTSAGIAIGSGTLTLRVRGVRSTYAFSDNYSSLEARRNIAEDTYSEWIVGAVGFNEEQVVNVTSVVQALVNSPLWTQGCTLFVDDFDEVTDPSVTRRIDFWSFDSGGNLPSLAIVTGGTGHEAEFVNKTSITSFSNDQVGKLLAWLTGVEALCWPHLREPI